MVEAIHKFEQAGLGLAPFRVIGCFEDRGPHRHTNSDGIETIVGSPGQAMGCCEYCFTGIALCFQIKSSDGKQFVVGSSCVYKTGDKGLVDPVKRTVNRLASKARKEREAKRIAEGVEYLAREDVRAQLDALPHPRDWARDQGQTMLDSVVWMMANAGNSGKLRTIRQARKLTEVVA